MFTDFVVNDSIQNLDQMLVVQLLDLKSQIEENELVHGIRSSAKSSLYIPKDPDFFKKERKFNFQVLLNVPTDIQPKIIAEAIRSELESCDKIEYNDRSIPILINRYYFDRLDTLVVMKHSLMLRWKRYCVNETLKEHIRKEYEQMLITIDDEYTIVSTRSIRLKVVKEGYVCKTDQALDEINVEDIMIYLKGLTIHFFAMRYMAQIIRILQWIPTKFKKKRREQKGNETQSGGKSDKSTKDLDTEGSLKSEHSKISIAKPPSYISSDLIVYEPFAGCGGGLSIDERNLNMPLHTNNINYFDHILKNLCQVYSIEMDIKSIRTSADEMELFLYVSRKFKTCFNIQEQMRTFKVYDKPDGGADRWGIDSCQHALLKPAAWMSHNPLKPKTSLVVSKYLHILKSQELLDEFLKTSSTFMKKSNYEDTQNSLRHHALIIQHLPVVHNTAVIANPKGFAISDIFKLVYNKSDFNLKTFSSEENKNPENVADQDTYNFVETLQMLGLDDCVETKDDPSSVQGAYLSYLSLRFLKIRDLQRTCLAILNYFRSIERSLVINMHGFSEEDTHIDTRRVPNKFDDEVSTKNLGNHKYLSDNMKRFKTSSDEFMKFGGVTNHDDFYFHEEGRPHVKDQMNYWIVYDVAVKDFEEMEEELIMIGSYYITIDKDYRLASLFNRKKSQAEHDENAAFITEHGHREVDRYGILYDLWNQHTYFMECKKRLVDIYMEVYNTISSSSDRRGIAQIITNIIYQKPRLDLTFSYFISSYRLESQILKAELEIMKIILDNEKERFRKYVLEDFSKSDGYSLVEKMLIHPNTDESVLQPLYILEFIPSMGMITQVKKSLEFAISTYKRNMDLNTVVAELKMECEFINLIQNEIRETNFFNGISYQNGMLDSLLSTYPLDNIQSITQIGEQHIKGIESRNTRGEKKAKKIKFINEFGRLLDLITVRFRLIDALWTSEYLSSIYQLQAINLGYDNFHRFMSKVSFEEAKKTDSAENYKPLLYISSVQDDDSMVSKYKPEKDCLAIHEIDTLTLGRLQFTKIPKILDLLISKGLEDLQLTFKMQYIHKSALEVGILLCDICRPTVYVPLDTLFNDTHGNDSPPIPSMSSYALPVSLQTGPIPLALDKSRDKDMVRYDFYPEAFFSLQLEKTPIRNKMLNEFLKKNANPLKLTPVELDKIKRDSVSYFITSLFERITHVALKAEIISYYSSIITLLKTTPDIALTFFQFGVDSKPNMTFRESIGNFDVDPRKLRNRSRKVISDNGKVVNIWYIPHFTEILFLHREMDDAKANKILTDFLRLVRLFHDILYYIFGFSSLTSTNVRVADLLKAKVTNDSGVSQEPNFFNIVHQLHFGQDHAINVFTDFERTNSFQLKKELMDLESQFGSLNDPSDIEEVIEMLEIRLKFHYFYFDVVLNSVFPDIFLASNNQKIHDKIRCGMKSTLNFFKDIPNSTYVFQGMEIPLPVIMLDKEVKKSFPWRYILSTHGPFVAKFHDWSNISQNLQLCFVTLTDQERSFVMEQFYNFNLSLEEILLEHGMQFNFVDTTNNDMFLLSTKFHNKDKKEAVEPTQKASEIKFQSIKPSRYLNIQSHPKEAYAILTEYLVSLKRFNLLKSEYYSEKMKMKNIFERKKYLNLSKLFRREIVFPQVLKFSEQLNLPYFYYFGPNPDGDTIIYPTGLTVSYINKNIMDALIFNIEKIKISKVLLRIQRQLDDVIKERNDDSYDKKLYQFKVLKKSYIKPDLSITIINKLESPFAREIDVVDDYTEHNAEEDYEQQNELKEESKDEQRPENTVSSITLNKKHLNNCLQHFTNCIQRVQRETYESYAMYFENLLKHQQRILIEKEITIKEIRDRFHGKEQSMSLQRQFMLAEEVSKLIMEINSLRARLKNKNSIENKESVKLKKNISLEYKFIVRNIYSLSFEQMTQMNIAVQRFRCNVIEKICETRIKATNELKKIKEKSGAKITADDDLLEKNMTINMDLNKSRQANFHASMFNARMKSLFNWVHTYSMNVNSQKIVLHQEESQRQMEVVPLIEMVAEQKFKLMKSEMKRLNETLTATRKDLSDLRATLSSEINQKRNKRKTEEMNAIKAKEGINHKRVQINKMLEVIKNTNAKMSTMQSLFDENIANKETVALNSQKKVDVLKRALIKERNLKQETFMKVDDLISQVYEFEAAFYIVRNEAKTKFIRESTIESLAKPKNPSAKPGQPTINLEYSLPEKVRARLTYKSVVNQYCLPYTPCHYLPFRRDRKRLHKTIMNIKHKIHKGEEEKDKLLILPKLRKLSTKSRNL